MNPAHELVGKTVDDKWLIVEKLKSDDSDSTGGFFSVPYKVKHQETGEHAFLKVVDMLKALNIYQQNEGITTAEATNRVTSSHLFECELAEACTGRKMTRVVKALHHGELLLTIPGTEFKLGHGYLLFELGQGDTHTLLKQVKPTNAAWKMRALHQTAVGLKQLHSADIAHQDLKRSNVVFFGENNAKICDLGRAVKRNRPSRNDARVVPCQLQNSPLELVYQEMPTTWEHRHFSTDLYMLGNLAFAIFVDTPITFPVIYRLPENLRPMLSWFTNSGFGGDYSEVVPALRNVLAKIVTESSAIVPEEIREKWVNTVLMLCEPDPAKRGHPRDHAMGHGQKYSAERFISAFREMELRLLVHGKQ